MKWKKEMLDLILVPAGLFLMFGYHIFLVYRYLRNYTCTVLGFHNHCQKVWVKKLMQIGAMSRGPAFTVMNSTIVASNFMASTSLTLSSLIGAWIGSSSSSEIIKRIIYGDAGLPITSIKYISILLFFLLAFASFIQSSRCYVQANLFLSMPKAAVPEDFIVEALVHGANFWQVGLRAIYFAITMLMWIFGPIPMFLSSAAMVAVLYVLDVNNKILDDFNESSEKEEERNEAVVGGCEKQEILDDGSSELQAAAALTTALLSTAFASL
ncbi:uncharacterized protein LOC104898836 [Beta vulgaris subsp. vulgaris]|uniref:uncharacterized protein LOC104898836 n=1 Tax=Beta vulgaris subsp. vulgaris TaxID=3555 RepID=UPI00203734EF|nr:uncharacterized protein LOC104898836 [Beta vulgaris subsp. vulgaris]